MSDHYPPTARGNAIAAADADAWLRRLTAGPLLASFTFYLVVAGPAGG